MKKIIILGPAGSGKTILADKLATELSLQAIHFDLIKYTAKKQMASIDSISNALASIKEEESWIVEGPATFLETLFEDATDIIFLDIDKDTCLINLRSRGSTGFPWEETSEELNSFLNGYETHGYDICYANIIKLLQNKTFIKLSSIEEINEFKLD